MLATILLNSALVTIAVTIHFEFLYRLSTLMPIIPIRHRYRVLVGVIGAMIAHVLEIWVFAFGYYYMVHTGHYGGLQGTFDGSILDCSYFSFTVYSTIGFGDIEPVGNIRFLVGLEALTGLILITWSASLLFLEMQKSWHDQ